MPDVDKYGMPTAEGASLEECIRKIVREEIAAHMERRVEHIGWSDEQKAALMDGLSKLSSEGNTDNMIGKQYHVLNI